MGQQMQHSCRQLLATTRWTGNQNTAICGGVFLNRLSQLIDNGRIANHFLADQALPRAIARLLFSTDTTRSLVP